MTRTCPVCSMKVRVTKDNRFANHRDGYRHPCPNSGSELPDLMAALEESLNPDPWADRG